MRSEKWELYRDTFSWQFNATWQWHCRRKTFNQIYNATAADLWPKCFQYHKFLKISTCCACVCWFIWMCANNLGVAPRNAAAFSDFPRSTFDDNSTVAICASQRVARISQFSSFPNFSRQAQLIDKLLNISIKWEARSLRDWERTEPLNNSCAPRVKIIN